MYHFNIHEFFPYSVRETFEATSKDFDSVQEYVPNLTLLKTLEQKQMGEGKVYWLLRFHGDGALPSLARPVIKPEMLRWHEEMICDHEKMTIEWKVITDYFTEHIHCGGITYYHEAEGGTDVEIKGSLSITLEKLPAIPSVIVKKAVKIVEPFIGKLTAPNMKEFYTAIKRKMETECLGGQNF